MNPLDIDGGCRQYPLLPYAAEFWYKHFQAREALAGYQVLELATKLFDPMSKDKFLHWLRVYNPDIQFPNQWSASAYPLPLYYSLLLELFDITEWLLKLDKDIKVNINVKGGLYGNVLQAATVWGNEAMVQLLLDHGANVNAEGGMYGNALQAATFWGNVQLLLDHGANINAEGGMHGSALQAPSAAGNKAVVQLLLDHGANINTKGGLDDNALPLG